MHTFRPAVKLQGNQYAGTDCNCHSGARLDRSKNRLDLVNIIVMVQLLKNSRINETSTFDLSEICCSNPPWFLAVRHV